MILLSIYQAYTKIAFDMFSCAYRMYALILFLSLAFSCVKEDDTGKGPTISFLTESEFISSDTIIAPGQKMKFGIYAHGGEYNITEILIQVVSDSAQIYFDTGFNTQYINWEGVFTKSFNKSETWNFIVRDRYGKSSSISLLITADTNINLGPINTFLNIRMGAQDNNLLGPCYSIIQNKTFQLEEAYTIQEDIDLIYYFFGEDENVIASPGANIESGVFPEEFSPVNWEIRNTTRYIKVELSEEEFDSIENDSILIANYIEGEGKRKAKNLVSGDIYSLKTQDQRFGMFKINEVIGAESGDVDFDLKIQIVNKQR